MAITPLYEVHYDAIKTTAKDTYNVREECMVEGTDIAEVYAKFLKHFPSKRGYSYEVTAIIKSGNNLIK